MGFPVVLQPYAMPGDVYSAVITQHPLAFSIVA